MTRVATSAYAKHLVPLDDLLDHISGLLEEAPRTMKELEALTGYTHRPLKDRLNELIEDGLAHRQRVPVTISYKYIYCAGSGDGVVDVARAGEVPRRTVARTYPPIGRRDVLVAALFGQVGTRPALVLKMER